MSYKITAEDIKKFLVSKGVTPQLGDYYEYVSNELSWRQFFNPNESLESIYTDKTLPLMTKEQFDADRRVTRFIENNYPDQFGHQFVLSGSKDVQARVIGPNCGLTLNILIPYKDARTDRGVAEFFLKALKSYNPQRLQKVYENTEAKNRQWDLPTGKKLKSVIQKDFKYFETQTVKAIHKIVKQSVVR